MIGTWVVPRFFVPCRMISTGDFLCAGVRREISSVAARIRRASREDGSSLLDCTRAPRGNMSAKADGQVKEIGDEREVRTDQGRGDPADQ